MAQKYRTIQTQSKSGKLFLSIHAQSISIHFFTPIHKTYSNLKGDLGGRNWVFGSAL